MSKIKARDTKAELIVRRFLFSHGFRYRINVDKLPGKPDIVLKKHNLIIDIRGCFWHAHQACKNGEANKLIEDHFLKRRKSAVVRDKKNETEWKKLGWDVLVIWECELEPRRKTSPKREETLKKILNLLQK